jgi:NAD(P)-dependent dehydrogenase (short-subunit alcohol dehydrogenase family)
MGRVTGKVALVTGGAMGMDKSHSELLAREGACFRDERAGKSLHHQHLVDLRHHRDRDSRPCVWRSSFVHGAEIVVDGGYTTN